MDIKKILNGIVVVGIAWLVICTVSMIFEERPQTDVADSSKLEDEIHEFDRAEYLETAKWGTLEKELEKMGVTDFTYENSEEKTGSDTLTPQPVLSHPKTLKGKIRDSVGFEVVEGLEELDNKADNLVFIIDDVNIDATDDRTELREDDKLYVSCDGAILLTQEQIDCIKYLKEGRKIEKPHLSYEGTCVEDWL